MSTGVTRRQFVSSVAAGTGLASFGIRVKGSEPLWRGKQFQNQPEDSHQQRFLVEMWDAVRRETGGRLDVTVYPQNNNIPGSDPQALAMIISGELEFFTLMGGILGNAVPAAEIQGVPFAFTSHEQVHRLNDGPLGTYLGKECAAKGIHRFQYGLFENGFRQIGMIDKPIRTADDLAGVKMRVPDAQLFRDLFRAFDAEPVTVNILNLYESLKTRRVDGQENPLVVVEFNKLYEVTKYVSITNHMWSGFNLLASRTFWDQLPNDVQTIVNRNVKKTVAAQRVYTNDLNRQLQERLERRGQIFNVADVASFRRKLGPAFYRRMKTQVGTTAWSIVEKEVGPLG